MPAVWIVKRNCSASPKVLALVLASVAAVAFAIGAAFAAFGLWLVLPFVGIEMLAVAAAFFVYARHAADYERIELVDGEVRVTRFDGRVQHSWRWPAVWTRVEQARDAGRLRITVGAFGEQIEVGQHLPAGRRAALADEIRAALKPAAA
jgi:uncharacterized membrane protein